MATPCILYRNGNSTSPRMDHVRCGHNINCFQQNNSQWVKAGTGGISTFSNHDTKKHWWELPIGSVIPNGLRVTQDPVDHSHYFWEPENDMTLNGYQQLLLQVGPWNKVTVDNTFKSKEVNEPKGIIEMQNMSPKSKRFIQMALSNQIKNYEEQLNNPTLDEDIHSDLVNDLMLFKGLFDAFSSDSP
jgi:hypothetical protein